MRIAFLIAIAVVVAIAPSPAAAFDRAAWQQDFAQLERALEDRYANLAWKASAAGGVDLVALDRAARRALAQAASDAQAADAIHAFVAAFHDGHFAELPSRAIAAGPATEPPQPALDADAPESGCAALGFASTGSAAFSLPVETLPGFRLVSNGVTSTFRTGLMAQSGVQLGFIRIQAFRARAFPGACLHAWATLKQAGAPIVAGAVKDAARMRWFEDLVDAMHTLQRAGAGALVIDIGNNSGGDDSGDWTARLFTDRAVRSARLMMVDAPVAAGYFDEEIADLRAALAKDPPPQAKAALTDGLAFFTAAKARIGKQHCDLGWAWREQRPWSPAACNRLLEAGYASGFSPGLPKGAYGDAEAARALAWPSTVESFFGAWTGPTYVLADSRSYSSAEMFAAVMQDNHVATLVGARTGGDGCGSMTDGPPLVLDHSRLRFRIPNCMRLRADGSNEEAGIAPDIPVLPTEGESDRARAQRVVALIAKDLAAKSSH
jgi:hypothetical protein